MNLSHNKIALPQWDSPLILHIRTRPLYFLQIKKTRAVKPAFSILVNSMVITLLDSSKLYSNGRELSGRGSRPRIPFRQAASRLSHASAVESPVRSNELDGVNSLDVSLG